MGEKLPLYLGLDFSTQQVGEGRREGQKGEESS